MRQRGAAKSGRRTGRSLPEAVNRNGDAYYLAEIYRIKGELLLMQATGRSFSRADTREEAVVEAEQPVVEQAESCFIESIRIARQQQAASWELRALMSLVRLYPDRRKQDAALVLLRQVYDRFTEGFETGTCVKRKRCSTSHRSGFQQPRRKR